MKFRKIAGILLLASLSMGLLACGGQKKQPGVTSEIASVAEDKPSSDGTDSQEASEDTKKPAIVDKTWEYKVDISWIDTDKPMVALSFDDGPVYSTGENSTATRIQNALSENGMHATFFYWGSTLNGITQKEIERAYELGFELGNHTKSHKDLSKLATSEEIEKEVEYMDKKLAEIADQEHFLVRPPYLGVNQRVKDTLIAPIITCGLDTKDWNNASAQQIIDTIVEAAEKGTLDGQIVLMHETYTTTAEAVEYLVPYLKELGYQVVSISEMYCARGKTMAGGKVFTSCAK